jgi:hypothetical protein
MTPEPKMSAMAPYHWVGCVVLTPDEVEELVNELPPDLRQVGQLRSAAQAAAQLARRLNEIDHAGRAA